MKIRVTILSIIGVILCCCSFADAFFGFGQRRAADKDDLYGVLGVSKGATEKEIKKAFRSIARTDHPDNKQTAEEKEEATTRMQDVLRAYTVLSDKDKRQEYDRYGSVAGEQPGNGGGPPPGHHHQGGGGGGYPPEFEEFMRRFGGRHGGRGGGQQRVPINSGAPTITLSVFVEKVLSYRGPRIHIIHTYSDYSGYSRAFGGVWEQFIRTPIATSSGVSSWRLRTDFHPGVNDGYDSAEEGAAIARFLVSGDLTHNAIGAEDYVSTPGIYAIVDGRSWELTGITDHLSNPAQAGLLLQKLVDFTRSFYSEFSSTIQLGASTWSAASFLAEASPSAPPPSSSSPANCIGRPVHALMSNPKPMGRRSPDEEVDALVGMAAGMMDEAKVQVRFCPNAVLIQTLVDTCGMTIAGGVVDVIVVVDATETPTQGRVAYNAKDDAPAWCKIAKVTSSRMSRLPRRRQQLINDMYKTDAALLKIAFPRRVPIIRGPNEFILTCVHGDKAKDCVIWVKRDCGSSGVLDFFDTPMWASNPDRFGGAVLVGLCLDRQPRLNAKLGGLLDDLARQMKTLRHRPSKDALLLYSHRRGEGTAYTMYLNEDLDRGGGLIVLEQLIHEFKHNDHVTRVKGAVTDILPANSPLPALFIDEAAAYRLGDMASITHNPNPPTSAFPVAWWRLLCWRVRDAYVALPFNSLIPIIVLYLVMSSCGGICRRGGRRNAAAQQQPPPPNFNPVPVQTSISAFNKQDDLHDSRAPPMLMLAVIHPSGNTTTQQASTEAHRDVTGSKSLMTDSRFRYREVSLENNPAAHADLMSHIGLPPGNSNYTAIVIRRKKCDAAIKPPGKDLTLWCLDAAEGGVTFNVKLTGPTWSPV